MTPRNKLRSPSDQINPLCKCFFGKGFGFRFEGDYYQSGYLLGCSYLCVRLSTFKGFPELVNILGHRAFAQRGIIVRFPLSPLPFNITCFWYSF